MPQRSKVNPKTQHALPTSTALCGIRAMLHYLLAHQSVTDTIIQILSLSVHVQRFLDSAILLIDHALWAGQAINRLDL